MTPGSSDDHGDKARVSDRCAECGGPLGPDQRYCLACGTRRGPLPEAVAASLPSLLAKKMGGKEPEPAPPKDAPPAKPEPPVEEGHRLFPPGYMPSPRVAAMAVLGMLGLGVLLGSATSQLAQSAGLSSIILEEPTPPPPEEVAEPEPEEFEDAFAEEPAPPVEEAIPSTVVPEEELPPEEAPPESAPEEPELPEEEFIEPTLPPVKHVFVIMLGENGYEETFGASSQAPYLAKTLPEMGELLPNYYAVTNSPLANQIALISGQGPTVETAAGCPNYTDISPGTISATTGQVEGAGCLYPAETPTLMKSLEEKKLKWKAYVESIGAGVNAGQPATCRHPAVGTADTGPTLEPGDFYQTQRNPFMYFHSVIDSPSCASTDVGLDQLALDLKTAKTTPALSYIVPNSCNDGGAEPCDEARPPGPATAEEFLKTIVPEIQASEAYKKEGGLIVITSTQAPQSAPEPDLTACCTTPAYPNLPPVPAPEVEGAVKKSGGGGKVGLLLLSPYILPGTRNENVYFNHYSLLLSILELFEMQRIGYTTDPATLGFEPTIFNNEGATVSSAQSKTIKTAVSKPRAIAPMVNVLNGHPAGSVKRPSSSARDTAER